MPRYVKLLRWLAAVCTLAVFAIMISGCIWIYTQSEFTRENAAEALEPVLVGCIADAVIIAVTCFVQRRYMREERTGLSCENRLRLMKKRIGSLPAEAHKEEIYRKNLALTAGIFTVIIICPAVIYILNRNNFVSWDLENVMTGVMLNVFTWTFAALCVVYVYIILRDRSIIRETEMLKNCGADAKDKPEKQEKNGGKYMRAVLYAAAAVFLVLGILNGGLRDVLVKAINICTECIGLG